MPHLTIQEAPASKGVTVKIKLFVGLASDSHETKLTETEQNNSKHFALS